MQVPVPDDLWDTEVVPEGVVSNWLYDEGALVEKGEVVAVIMVEKTEYDIEAPATGKLHIVADQDAAVTPGTVIADIEESG
jgi:pyruvate/2-oxoglutarate dehydrogenase complex dihydrolipoamide acyltransferase (E2) component